MMIHQMKSYIKNGKTDSESFLSMLDYADTHGIFLESISEDGKTMRSVGSQTPETQKLKEFLYELGGKGSINSEGASIYGTKIKIGRKKLPSHSFRKIQLAGKRNQRKILFCNNNIHRNNRALGSFYHRQNPNRTFAQKN